MLGPRPTPRKRWNLHDGPRGSLKRLRLQLAKDGCAESQLQLARNLLEERCELEADRLSNFEQAMEWLICATEQGHKEARKTLGRCVQSGVMNPETSVMARAKSCLAAGSQETIARKAARVVFACLSNGGGYITSVQLEQKMRELWSMKYNKDDDLSSSDETEESEHDPPDGGPRNDDQLETSPEAVASDIFENHNNSLTTDEKINNDFQDEYEPSIEENIQNISEDNLVSAAVTYCQGQLPIVSQALTLTDPNIRALDRIPYMHRAFLHPIIFLQIIYIKILSYFSSFSFQLTPMQVLLIFFGHSVLGTENIVLFFPMIFYYASFAFIIITTFKMLNAKRKYVDFRKWSGLFLRYSEGNLNSNETENQFVKNNLRPFFHFFAGLFVHLLFYPMVATQWLPLSEFTVAAFFLTFLTLFTFAINNSYSDFPDWLAFLSFGINVLAKYPYEEDTVVSQGWRFLDLQIQTFPSYLIGNSLELCLNSRVLFYLMIPGIIFQMARRERWHGIYKYAIPHCVVLSWLQIFIINSQGATMYGLMRGTLALVGTFLFLPIMGVATIFVPVFAVVKMITLTDVLQMTALIGGVLVLLIIMCVLAANKTMQKYVTYIQILLCSGALLFLFLPNMQKFHYANMVDTGSQYDLSQKDDSDEYIKFDDSFLDDTNIYYLHWEDYQTFCHAASWEKSSVTSVQMKCSILDNVKISWHGYVTDVRITGVENAWNYYANKLPNYLREYFVCYFGQEYEFACDTKTGDARRECQFLESIAKRENKRCHLNKYNSYAYEITVRMESGILLKKGSEILLKAGHNFSNFTQKIRPNDKISFKGVIEPHETLSTPHYRNSHPVIALHELGCIGCQNSDIRTVKSHFRHYNKKLDFNAFYKSMLEDLATSAKCILNFVFNPIFIFK